MKSPLRIGRLIWSAAIVLAIFSFLLIDGPPGTKSGKELLASLRSPDPTREVHLAPAAADWESAGSPAPEIREEAAEGDSSVPRPGPKLVASSNEQNSLWSAFSDARHGIQTLTPHEAAMDRNQGVRFFAQNPGQRLTARFLEQSVRIESGRGDTGWSATFTTPSLPAATEVTSEGTRVEYLRGTVTEWFDNRIDGFEHGLVVREPMHAGNELRITVAVEGLHAEAQPESPGSIHLFDGSGEPRLSYDKLLAWDATGAELPARMETGPDGIDLVIGVGSARYPLTIDPLIASLEQKLRPEITGDAIETDGFGVAVSIDGDTALIGAPLSDTPAGSLSGSAYVFIRSGNEWTLQSKLSGNDTNSNDRFGNAVSLEGSTAVVAADNDSPRGSGSGSTYVFVRQGAVWSQQAKLVPSDLASNDNFGNSVSLSGSYLLIGATSDDSPAGAQTGAAYIYFKSGSTWTQQAKLLANDAAASDYFGSSVSLDGATAVVGARLDDDKGSASGSAYVFTRSGTTWSLHSKLTASDGTSGDALGVSISLAGDDLVIGASLDGVNGSNSGSAYVFTRSAGVWTQQAKLLPSDGSSTALFGASVSVEGDTALVGAPWKDSAYVFARSGGVWQQQVKLTASDDSVTRYFGTSVQLDGDAAFIGAANDSTVIPGPAGAAYVFLRGSNGWSQSAKLSLGGDSAAGDGFGGSLAIQGERAVIGASGDNTAAGYSAGSAYVFTRNGETWTTEARIHAADGTTQDYFGNSVSLDGNTILVGAVQDAVDQINYSTGSAYVFVRSGSGWTQQAKLIAGDVDSLDYFGCSVSVSGDRALIGSYWDRTRRGSAYIFVRNGGSWTQQAKLIDPEGRSEDNLGSRVRLSGTTALVAAATDDDLGNASGSVFVFTADGTTWTQQAKLHADDGSEFDYFGTSIAFSGDTALIGAPGGTGDLTYPGCAYVFTRTGSTWSQRSKLVAADGSAEDRFGGSVALEEDLAVIGAARDATAGKISSGSAYVFQFDGSAWQQQAKLASADPGEFDNFGSDVSLSGDTVLVGASGDDGVSLSGNPAEDQGSVHVFRVREPSSEIAVFLDTIDQPLVAGGEARPVFRATVSNTGSNAASGLVLETSGLPSGAAITGAVASSGTFTNGTWNLSLPAGRSATLTLSLKAGSGLSGSVPLSLALTSVDPADTTPSNNRADASVPVISAELADLEVTLLPVIERQNGLWVGRLNITNRNPTAVPAFRVYATGLPAGATLHNAHGIGANGLPYLLYNQPLAPGASIELSMELFTASRTLASVPQFDVEVLAVAQFVPSAGTSGLAVTRMVKLSNGDFLLEIESTPGVTYVIEYSDDATSWRRVSGTVTAHTNRLQWIDSGSPKTVSHPSTVPSRFYRFAEIPAAD